MNDSYYLEGLDEAQPAVAELRSAMNDSPTQLTGLYEEIALIRHQLRDMVRSSIASDLIEDQVKKIQTKILINQHIVKLSTTIQQLALSSAKIDSLNETSSSYQTAKGVMALAGDLLEDIAVRNNVHMDVVNEFRDKIGELVTVTDHSVEVKYKRSAMVEWNRQQINASTCPPPVVNGHQSNGNGHKKNGSNGNGHYPPPNGHGNGFKV